MEDRLAYLDNDYKDGDEYMIDIVNDDVHKFYYKNDKVKWYKKNNKEKNIKIKKKK